MNLSTIYRYISTPSRTLQAAEIHMATTAQREVLNAGLVGEGLVTVAQACRFLAVSRSFLYGAMERGEIAYCRLGRARRIPVRALMEYAAKRLQGGWAVEGDGQKGT